MKRTRLAFLVVVAAGAVASAHGAFAQGPPAPPPAASGSAAPGIEPAVTGCTETIPKGAQRPAILDSFPTQGKSGWAAVLTITIRHGKGERVLPSGLDLGSAAEAKKLLKSAGFAIPEQDGGASARLWSDPEDKAQGTTTTHLELPLVPLPDKPGRNTMILPPLPVAIARANGEVATVCTHGHPIVVEDPTASTPDAKPKANPPPRKQLEEWTALKKAVTWGGLGLLAGALLAWLLYRHLTKPKPVPPPPPPRPPWEIALERLDEVRHAGLLEVFRYTEYFDRTSDAVRGYLGARFGFDGLESTTDEILAALERQAGGFVRVGDGVVMEGAPQMPMPGVPLERIAAFLRECDLVKFANLTPTEEHCARALDEGEAIVRATIPGSGFGPQVPRPASPTRAVAKSAPPPRPIDPDAAYMPPAAPAPPAPPPAVTGPPPPDPGPGKKDGAS